VLKGKGFFHTYSSKGTITVSSHIWRDSAFPFENGDNLEIEIQNGGTLVVRKKQAQSQKRLTNEA